MKRIFANHEYKVDGSLAEPLRKVMARGFWSCHARSLPDGRCAIVTDAPPEKFERILQRAQCEQKEAETGKRYVTRREGRNALFLDAMFGERMPEGVCILRACEELHVVE